MDQADVGTSAKVYRVPVLGCRGGGGWREIRGEWVSEWVAKVRVGRGSETAFISEWKFYGSEILQSMPLSCGKYRLQKRWAEKTMKWIFILQGQKVEIFTSGLKFRVCVWIIILWLKYYVVWWVEWEECNVRCGFGTNSCDREKSRKTSWQNVAAVHTFSSFSFRRVTSVYWNKGVERKKFNRKAG